LYLLLEIADIVLPVFLIISLGFFLGKRELLNRDANERLSMLIFYVAAPALLFRGAALTPLSNAIDLKALLAIAGVTTLTALAAYLVLFKSSPSRRGVLAQGVQRSNMVLFGLPIIDNAFGPAVLGPTAVLVGFMIPVYNLLAVLLLTLPHHADEQDTRGVWKKAAFDILKNPLIISTIGGILFSVLKLPLPVSIDRSLDLVGRTTIPVALICIGASLDFSRVRSEIIPAGIVSAFKLLIYPAMIYVVLGALAITGVERQATVLIFASPTAVVSYIMAQEMKGDTKLASAIVIGSTVASLFTVSAWIAFFKLTGPV